MSIVFREEYGDDALAAAYAWASDHVDFIDAVTDVFLDTGDWPTAVTLQRDLDRADNTLDVYQLAKELPRQLGAQWRGPDGEIVLRIRALRFSRRARPILAAAVSLLRIAYERYRSQDDVPKLHASDLTSDDLRRGAILLQRELFSVLHGSHDRYVPDWEGLINSGLVRELKGVQTVDDYLDREAQYFRNEAYSAAAAQRSAVTAGLRNALASADDAMRPLLAGTGAGAVPEAAGEPDRSRVFVVHGRNLELRDTMFAFLRAIRLDPIEFSEARGMTGKPNPYIGEILDAAFAHASAVLVLMSPDDAACLRSEFRTSSDERYETELTGAARQNVIFEAGMAMGRDDRRTVLVQCGSVRPFSDIGGRHALRLDNTVAKRQQLAERLRDAGCAVIIERRTDWHTIGNFAPATLDFDAAAKTDRQDPPASATQPETLDIQVEALVEGSRAYLRVTNASLTNLVLGADVMEVTGLSRDVVAPWGLRWRDGGDVRDLAPGWPQLLLVADGDGMGNARRPGDERIETARWTFHTIGEAITASTAVRSVDDIYAKSVDLRVRIYAFAGSAWTELRLRLGFENENDPTTGNLRVRAQVIA